MQTDRVEAGCFLWGVRVVVPALCQEAVLRELHTSHPGIVGINLQEFMSGGRYITSISNIAGTAKGKEL